MRYALAAVVLAGCGAQLGSGGGAGDAGDPGADGPPPTPDARIDAPADARACAGGDAAAVAPDGSCLVLFTTPQTYAGAKAGCAAISAHLAYLKTSALDAFAATFAGNRDVFVGGDDLAVEGTFVWGDGSTLAYTNWGPTEPNNSAGGGYQEDCIVLATKHAMKWDDRPCDASEVATSGRFAYLCQY